MPKTILMLGLLMTAASAEVISACDPWVWAVEKQIRLQTGPYSLARHEYQIDPMQCKTPRRVMIKATQGGWTEVEVLRSLHGMIHGKYPQGVLYLFPTGDDVVEFSKSRFGPLIEDNYDSIGKYVKSTDAASIKRINRAWLFLRGARLNQRIDGAANESSKLRSVPVDKLVFDERDLMPDESLGKARGRMGHSLVKEEVHISNPTIPEYGIHAEWLQSDRRHWHIRCMSCNHWTCLELEFPNCIHIDRAGAGHRVCASCGRDIDPSMGEWVAAEPSLSQTVAGWWWSQLISYYVDPALILREYEHPPEGNLGDVKRLRLGMPHIDAENQLTMQEVLACCGSDTMRVNHPGPTAMGVDVGKTLHVLIAEKRSARQAKIVYAGQVPEFEDLHDLAARFNVKSAVIDMEPETRKAREFQRAEPYAVWLCDYAETTRKKGDAADDKSGVLVVGRTEICDRSHKAVTDLALELPRRGHPEIQTYAEHMHALVKCLQVDEMTGRQRYIYRQIKADHYRHATNYLLLAMDYLRYTEPTAPMPVQTKEEYDPLRRNLA